jgi:hypothetical protein
MVERILPGLQRKYPKDFKFEIDHDNKMGIITFPEQYLTFIMHYIENNTIFNKGNN